MIRIIKLAPTPEGIELFSYFFMSDKKHNYDMLFKKITLWMTGLYNVYVPMDQNVPMGICHGDEAHEQFWGHWFFMKEFRGKSALIAARKIIAFIFEDLEVEQLIGATPPENKPGRSFMRALGFEKINGRYVYARV